LFLSISTAISNLDNRGIYPDLLRKFADEGHEVYIVAPVERRLKVKTNHKTNKNVTTLLVQTLNITKTNLFEKGVSTLLIEYLFHKAIQKYFKDIKFELILYSTPPITFNHLIKKLKLKHHASTYLLLKDIFPQNAVDLRVLSKINPLYFYFRKKEADLYKVSDFIGCMSPANVSYLKKSNPEIPAEKIEVCPNSITPVNLDNFHHSNDVWINYNVPKDKTICVYGGNLGKPQGIDFLIQVLKSNNNNKEVFFIVAGSGTEAYKIKQYREVEKQENMLFIPQLQRNDFDCLLNICDIGLIFLDPRYTIPNYPSRLLNYLEFKKPVLMAIDCNTDVGTIAEKNGYGKWVENGNLINFNLNLSTLVKNPSLRRTMGEKGYEFLINNYTVDKSYETILSHFMHK